MALSKQQAVRFVWLIGIVSFFADMTYQGAHGNAGPFLASLGATGTVVGVVAGAGELVNYTLRLAFGYWADKSRAYWAIAFPGYVLNLIAVPLLAVAGHWWVAAALLILERTGKGIRTPARDVMLSHAADQVGRGWAFGVHEAMDQAGGMLGPLLTAGILFWKESYSLSFGLLAIPATLAILVLVLTYREFPHPEDLPGKKIDLSTKGLPRAFWLLLAGMGALAVGYADFALMAYHLKVHRLFGTAMIPVLFGIAMGLQGVSSLLFGRWFDRWGVSTLLWAAVAGAAYSPLVFLGGLYGAIAGVALWTVGMGAQSSIMKALVAQVVPAERRGSAYGVLNAAYGVLWFLGSASMGVLYDHTRAGAVVFALICQAVALPILISLKKTTI